MNYIEEIEKLTDQLSASVRDLRKCDDDDVFENSLTDFTYSFISNVVNILLEAYGAGYHAGKMADT